MPKLAELSPGQRWIIAILGAIFGVLALPAVGALIYMGALTQRVSATESQITRIEAQGANRDVALNGLSRDVTEMKTDVRWIREELSKDRD